jgi:hypothetical protein
LRRWKIMPDDIQPSKADKRAVRQGMRQVITGMTLLIFVVLGVGAVLVINKQADAIIALSTSLSAQNQQFDACKGKAANAVGCSEKVSAEPAVIIKQVGAQGLPGSQGIQGVPGTNGTPGIPGPPGPIGARGPGGPTPACMLLPSKCVGQSGTDGKDGADGTNGTNGKDGIDGVDGTNGIDGKNGTDGKDGKDGAPGKSASAECIDAGNTWGPVEVSRPTPLLPVTILTCTVNQENP